VSSTGNPTRAARLFGVISWAATGLIVFGLLGFTYWKIQPIEPPAAPPPLPPAFTPTAEEGSLPPLAGLPGAAFKGIPRLVSLKTSLPAQVRYYPVAYTVRRGDSVFGIARQYSIKPETLLWANYDILQDSPDSIRVGQELKIPAVDGVYYQWQAGDTVEAVAAKFKASTDDILAWPGNDIDLTAPEIEAGAFVMVPGGKREFVQWIIPTVARGKSGTAGVSSTSCRGGPVGSGAFVWPAGNHYLSGNDYWSGHLGIDIADGEGGAVYAADSGVVTMAQGGWNYGYGNVIMIDHGNGYVTLYAHLSQLNVGSCQSVYAGQLIGLSGNTGNSFGAHLHFEVRLDGGFVNPWYVLP
jgi:murein DD-endopeptidase MepM/ murein hydrolase activator NlpD